MSQRDAHESYAVAARKLHWVAAILAGTLAGIMLLMYVLAHTWLRTTQPPPGAIPPQPRLQSDPKADLAAVRVREQAMLEGYAWGDRDAGIARIPLTRAMEIVTQSSSSAPAASGSSR